MILQYFILIKRYWFNARVVSELQHSETKGIYCYLWVHNKHINTSSVIKQIKMGLDYFGKSSALTTGKRMSFSRKILSSVTLFDSINYTL